MSNYTQVKTLPIGMYLAVNFYHDVVEVLTHTDEDNINHLEKKSEVDFFMRDDKSYDVTGYCVSSGVTEIELYQLIALPINNQMKVKKFLNELKEKPTHIIEVEDCCDVTVEEKVNF